jgi:aromatic-L-amino-acid decarboxylase
MISKAENMRKRIEALAAISDQLDMSESEFSSFFRSSEAYSKEFVRDTYEGKAYRETDDKGLGLRSLEFPLEGKRDPNELLQHYREFVERVGLNPASGGHLAYIPGGGVPVSAFGDYIAALTNRYSGVFFANPGAVRMENLLIDWMSEQLGFGQCYGNLASGGSIANLIAVTSARDAQEVEAERIREAVVYLTEQAHHSVQKALRIAGLGPAVLRYIPLDDHYRMDVAAFRSQVVADVAAGLKPFLLVSAIGTTDTGAIDPIAALDEVCKEHSIWHHIDGAYGGFFLMLPEFKELRKAMSCIDSFTVDPHKGLFLPYGLGAVLVRDKEKLGQSHYYLANYMQDTEGVKDEESPAEFSPELTKHYRGLRMWMPLMYYGTDPFRAGLQEKLWLCQYFYEKVQELGFEVGPHPELSVCIYRYVPKEGDANAFNLKLTESVRIDGRVFLSSTTINGVVWMRLAVLSFRSKLSTIDQCLEVLQELTEGY